MAEDAGGEPTPTADSEGVIAAFEGLTTAFKELTDEVKTVIRAELQAGIRAELQAFKVGVVRWVIALLILRTALDYALTRLSP